ncbi:MAG: hypothetical protein JWO30_2609 [Fibrobacteres bacterium]|nr:hypothetical protein [Fibrobacterota bacterium]
MLSFASKAAVAMSMLIAGSGAAVAESAISAPEYNVKAGYLLLFIRYVTWPDTTFASPQSFIIVGVLGRDPFGKVLEETFADAAGMTGRKTEIRRVSDVAGAMGCHVVFISDFESGHTAEWLAALRDKPILTVTETEEGADAGSIINFIKEGNRVRFEVNLMAAHRVGLKIASPVLVSARNVGKQGGKEEGNP